MKRNNFIATLFAGTALTLSGQALAAGTSSGTDITNTATLNYSVGGSPATTETVDATFKVDARIDFSLELQDSSIILVTPKGGKKASTFKLVNDSNEALNFNFLTSEITGGDHNLFSSTYTDTSDFGATHYVENGNTDGFQENEDTATSLTGLAPDDEATIYVVVDMDLLTFSDASDGMTSVVELEATAKKADGSDIPNQDSNSFNQNTKQYVFADTDRDGIETGKTAFQISSPAFTDPDDASQQFRMDVVVINDLICDENMTSQSNIDYSDSANTCPTAGASYKPKAIPGAMVKYTIHAQNSGSANATNVTFSENIATQNSADANFGINLQADSIDNIEGTTSGSGNIDTSTSDENNVNVTFDVVEPSDIVTVSFTAIIE